MKGLCLVRERWVMVFFQLISRNHMLRLRRVVLGSRGLQEPDCWSSFEVPGRTNLVKLYTSKVYVLSLKRDPAAAIKCSS